MSKIKPMGAPSLGETSFSHGKGKLGDVGLPNPQEYAKDQDGQGMSGGKGDGQQHLGVGDHFSKGSIEHIPSGKGPGTAQGLTAGKPKGLDAPFGSADTKKP